MGPNWQNHQVSKSNQIKSFVKTVNSNQIKSCTFIILSNQIKSNLQHFQIKSSNHQITEQKYQNVLKNRCWYILFFNFVNICRKCVCISTSVHIPWIEMYFKDFCGFRRSSTKLKKSWKEYIMIWNDLEWFGQIMWIIQIKSNQIMGFWKMLKSNQIKSFKLKKCDLTWFKSNRDLILPGYDV